MKKKLTYVFLGVVAYLVVVHIVVSLFSLHTLVRPSVFKSSITPSDYSMEYEDISFYADDGVKLKGWFIPSLKDEEVPTVVLLHGYLGDKGSVFYSSQHLVENFNVLLFDFRYMGDSGGRYSTLGIKETRDLHAALDFLEEEKEADNIFLWGFSMGAAVSVMVAPERDVVKGVVCNSPYADIREMSKEIYSFPVLERSLMETTLFWARLIFGVDFNDDSPLKKAPLVDVPVFLMHAREDPVVPLEHSKVLQEAFSTEVQTYFPEESSHGGMERGSYKKIEDFLLSIEI